MCNAVILLWRRTSLRIDSCSVVGKAFQGHSRRKIWAIVARLICAKVQPDRRMDAGSTDALEKASVLSEVLPCLVYQQKLVIVLV